MKLPDGPWAILRSHLDNYINTDADLFAAADPDEIEAMYAARSASRSGSGTVAVVPIHGPITKRDSFFTLFFGGTSTERLTAQMHALAADETIGTVLLDVDSPGGTVSGLVEAAAEIRKLGESKRVVAISNDLSASAAYWLTSQASEVVAAPESLTGSIGVYTVHDDFSGALEQAGIKVTYIATSDEKVEGNPDEPLSDEAREHTQGIIDSMMDLFVADVAKGRGVSAAKVRSDFGKGRVLDAKAAKAAGLVDRIATYSETVARLAGRSRGGAVATGGEEIGAYLTSFVESLEETDIEAETFTASLEDGTVVATSETHEETEARDTVTPQLDRWRFRH